MSGDAVREFVLNIPVGNSLTEDQLKTKLGDSWDATFIGMTKYEELLSCDLDPFGRRFYTRVESTKPQTQPTAQVSQQQEEAAPDTGSPAGAPAAKAVAATPPAPVVEPVAPPPAVPTPVSAPAPEPAETQVENTKADPTPTQPTQQGQENPAEDAPKEAPPAPAGVESPKEAQAQVVSPRSGVSEDVAVTIQNHFDDSHVPGSFEAGAQQNRLVGESREQSETEPSDAGEEPIAFTADALNDAGEAPLPPKPADAADYQNTKVEREEQTEEKTEVTPQPVQDAPEPEPARQSQQQQPDPPVVAPVDVQAKRRPSEEDIQEAEEPKYTVGDRVVGTLGDFGTIAIYFGELDYGVDFDDGSKYRVKQDQLCPLPHKLPFPIGCNITYTSNKSSEVFTGIVEKYFGQDIYGVRFNTGKKYRVKGETLQLAHTQEELECLREPRGDLSREVKMARRARAQRDLKIEEDTDVATWNVETVCAWLDHVDMSCYRQHFEEEEVNGKRLLNLTLHTLSDIGVKLRHRAKILQELDNLRETCKESTIPGNNGVILTFKSRPFDFEIEWYNYNLTITEINKDLSKAGLCRGMKVVSCNGLMFKQQSFKEMLDILKTASLPACIKFEKILITRLQRPAPKSKEKTELAKYMITGPTYIIKQGWLSLAMRDSGGGKEPDWKKRWCVLQSDDSLHFYTKPDSKKERGWLDFSTLSNSPSAGEKTNKDYFTFIVPCKETVYKFKCLSEQYQNSWIRAIDDMFESQKKRVAHAPLPQGPSRIIESLIRKNELSALWRHPQNEKTAFQLCLEMDKMDILLRYINDDQKLLLLPVDEGGVDLRTVIVRSLEIVNAVKEVTDAVPKEKAKAALAEDIKMKEAALTLIGTIYDRIPEHQWYELLPPPYAVIDNLVEFLHDGTKEPKEGEPNPHTLDTRITRSCEAVIATLCQPNVLRRRDNLHHAILRCFENKNITHLFEILLKTRCNLTLQSQRMSLLYRVIDLHHWDVSASRYSHMFETLVHRGAAMDQLSYGDQADMNELGIDALTKSISLLHIESIGIMLRHGATVEAVHTKALFTLVTRPDVVIIDKQKYLETLELILMYGAILEREEWMNMGSFVKADGTDLKNVGERARKASQDRMNGIREALQKHFGPEEKILDSICSYIPHFDAEFFETGLEKFLKLREKCLEERFPKTAPMEQTKDEKCLLM